MWTDPMYPILPHILDPQTHPKSPPIINLPHNYIKFEWEETQKYLASSARETSGRTKWRTTASPTRRAQPEGPGSQKGFGRKDVQSHYVTATPKARRGWGTSLVLIPGLLGWPWGRLRRLSVAWRMMRIWWWITVSPDKGNRLYCKY